MLLKPVCGSELSAYLSLFELNCTVEIDLDVCGVENGIDVDC